VAASVLSAIAVALMPNNFRVGGAVNWILYFIFAPLPVLAGVPLAYLVALDPYAGLPPTAMVVIVSVLWIYLIMPAVLPDFQADTFVATLVPSVLIGAGLFIGGIATNSFPNGLLLGTTDDQKVFIDRSAGLDLYGTKGEE
jgi:uncharacterized BrkB/YihY/UPF0761 family membrane protein